MCRTTKRLKVCLSNLAVDELEVEGSVMANDFVGPAKPTMDQWCEITKEILKASGPVVPSVDGNRILAAVFAWIENEVQRLAEHQFGSVYPNCAQSHDAIVWQ